MPPISLNVGFALLQIFATVVNASFEQCGKVNVSQLLNKKLHLDDDEYPWMGIVREEDENKICISMLITRRHVILPAQCVTDKINSVVFGNPTQEGGGGGGEEERSNKLAYELEEVAVHPDYVKGKYIDSDIAIGTLNRDVTDIQPICMPPKDEPKYFGQRLEMIGSTNRQPRIRIKGQAHIATQQYCSSVYHTIVNASNQLCGHMTEPFLAGSAIMGVHVPEDNPSDIKFYLTGILYGTKVISSTSHRLFLNINHYRDWIMRNSFEYL